MLSGLQSRTDRRVLVDMSTSDDAGVVRLDRERGLIHTIDVITPIVDDPKSFGRVAAANAVSDVYAMGGTPLSAVSLMAPLDQWLAYRRYCCTHIYFFVWLKSRFFEVGLLIVQ